MTETIRKSDDVVFRTMGTIDWCHNLASYGAELTIGKAKYQIIRFRGEHHLSFIALYDGVEWGTLSYMADEWTTDDTRAAFEEMVRRFVAK